MSTNLTWLFAAFAIGWGIVFLYLFRISQKEMDVRRRVAALEELLTEKEKD